MVLRCFKQDDSHRTTIVDDIDKDALVASEVVTLHVSLHWCNLGHSNRHEAVDALVDQLDAWIRKSWLAGDLS